MPRHMIDRFINSALFYIGWGICLDSASRGDGYVGIMSVLAIIVYQLARSAKKSADLCLIIGLAIIGPVTDYFYDFFGIVHYSHGDPFQLFLPPLWIASLWALYAVNVGLFSWFENRKIIAALFGGGGGAASYWSAMKLGALQPLFPLSFTLGIIGLVWAFIFPFSMALRQLLIEHFCISNSKAGKIRERL